MFRIKFLRNIARPFFPKKFRFPRKTRVYGQKRAKMPKIEVFRTLRENASLTFSNFFFKNDPTNYLHHPQPPLPPAKFAFWRQRPFLGFFKGGFSPLYFSHRTFFKNVFFFCKMCRKIDYKRIGQNLEIFPAGDTGLRLRNIFKNVLKIICLLFCCEMYRKIYETHFWSPAEGRMSVRPCATDYLGNRSLDCSEIRRDVPYKNFEKHSTAVFSEKNFVSPENQCLR